MNIGYKRVSTKDQNADRQLADIPLERVFIDYISGSKLERPQLELCLATLREGDILHVHAVDRLARSLVDAITIIERVLSLNASIIIYSPRLEFHSNSNDALAKFQLQLFASIAELERSLIRTRQREGIDLAKRNGTKSGKPFGQQPLDPSLRPKAIELLNSGLTVTDTAKALKISRASVYNLCKGAEIRRIL